MDETIETYIQRSAPYTAMLDAATTQAELAIGHGAEWTIAFGPDGSPMYFILIDGAGQRVCAVLTAVPFRHNGQFVIVDPEFRMITSVSGIGSALHTASDLAGSGLVRPDMGAVDPDLVRVNLQRALDEMIMQDIGEVNSRSAKMIVSIVLAVIAERRREHAKDLFEVATQHIDEYASIAERFNYATRADEEPDWITIQGLSLDISIARNRIITLVMAHMNRAVENL